ncbi:MAG: DEAD/DEAH box helicase [Thermoplasmata archaeon]|nr:DEAD/DEAH box helicase [Thermoplasmata archaeon]
MPAPPSSRTTVGAAVPVPATSVPVERLPIEPAIREILAEQGIMALYPPQAAAAVPVLEGKSVLLACPTASGKSLVAYLGLLRAVRAGRTGLYLVPLRALAQEKFEELAAFERLGIRVGLSIGDFDLANAALEKLDILVATSEKADGLLRKGSPWLDRLGAVVADEVHLMRDPDRGPTLEVSLTRLRRRHPELQVIALSATVGNSGEVAEWLGAVHVASDFRPVPLKMGVYQDGRITFTDLSTRPIAGPGEPIARLVRTVIQDGGQALVFVNTRRASEQVAQALVGTVHAQLDAPGRIAARQAAEELGGVSEEETEGIRRLSHLLPSGVAFHNASLTNPERRVVERAFRDRVLKVLVATPTLAAGINLPARRVIVRDTYRYDDRIGSQAPIPALEVQQMCGRAGRPRFDPTGEAVLLARSPEEQERMMDQYLSAPPEDIVSRLAAEPALRMHLLALVASGEVGTEEALESFFAATFYGRTLPMVDLVDTIRTVRTQLERDGFLEPGRALRATPFGLLTSELYLDPLSAVVLRRALERAPFGVAVFPLLAAIAATPDMPPLFLRRGEEREMLGRYTDEEAELLVKPEEEPNPLDLDLFLATIKTAQVLEAWLDETPIVDISERFGIGAGDLRAKVEDAEWLLFGASRIASRFQRRLARPLDDLSLRVRYGAREELLDLVHLKGIGRARGRALFNAGFPDRDALRSASFDRVAGALRSPRLAEAVLKEVKHPSPARSGGPPAPAAAGAPASPTVKSTPSIRPRGRRKSLEEYHTDPDARATR